MMRTRLCLLSVYNKAEKAIILWSLYMATGSFGTFLFLEYVFIKNNSTYFAVFFLIVFLFFLWQNLVYKKRSHLIRHDKTVVYTP